eukprot:TRINITY_DN59227_c0_g1_i1.p1 TRINITY_DN59227_c0_g1~~TRINITY_DN59227_c0_g1_i1.p1  ORF type:complete len:429 (-),score=44.73 TRINITY_DN59227_c0_g1_i1:2-1288(-)
MPPESGKRRWTDFALVLSTSLLCALYDWWISIILTHGDDTSRWLGVCGLVHLSVLVIVAFFVHMCLRNGLHQQEASVQMKDSSVSAQFTRLVAGCLVTIRPDLFPAVISRVCTEVAARLLGPRSRLNLAQRTLLLTALLDVPQSVLHFSILYFFEKPLSPSDIFQEWHWPPILLPALVMSTFHLCIRLVHWHCAKLEWTAYKDIIEAVGVARVGDSSQATRSALSHMQVSDTRHLDISSSRARADGLAQQQLFLSWLVSMRGQAETRTEQTVNGNFRTIAAASSREDKSNRRSGGGDRASRRESPTTTNTTSTRNDQSESDSESVELSMSSSSWLEEESARTQENPTTEPPQDSDVSSKSVSGTISRSHTRGTSGSSRQKRGSAGGDSSREYKSNSGAKNHVRQEGVMPASIIGRREETRIDDKGSRA